MANAPQGRNKILINHEYKWLAIIRIASGGRKQTRTTVNLRRLNQSDNVVFPVAYCQ